MDVAAYEGDFGHGGVEVLVLELADLASVHGVGPVGGESLDVELVGTESDLFVGVECHAYVAVGNLGMIDQIVDCGYDFGDAGFVVGSEQCGSVGHDQILSAIARQLGKFIGRECDSELGVEDYVASIVVLDYARIDVAARHVGRCV